MPFRIVALAALAVPIVLATESARADCLWDARMAERDLMSLERAAPLAADRSLPLGPGGPDRFSGAEYDFAERAMLAFGASSLADENTDPRPEVIEEQVTRARNRLDAARSHVAVGDMQGCATALEEARQAIAGARAAFR